MSDKKYILTDLQRQIQNNIVLHRIRAVKGFDSVIPGEYGGWVESEDNLSQDGTCWIYDDACVYGDARVKDQAKLYDDSTVCDHATVSDEAIVANWAIVSDMATIKHKSDIRSHAVVCDCAVTMGSSIVTDCAIVSGHTILRDSAVIRGTTILDKEDELYGIVRLSHTPVFYTTVGPIGSRNDTATFYLAKDNRIWVETGCFVGTLIQFEKSLKIRHGDRNPKIYNEYTQAIKMAKAILDRKMEQL